MTKNPYTALVAGAGVVEFGACPLAMNKGLLPPSASPEKVASGCESVTKFVGDYVRSNSFGFGGQNATLLLNRIKKS